MNIIIYTKTGCPWCIQAIKYLKDKKLSFEERNVSSSLEFFNEMVKKSGQTKAPTLDIDGYILADSDSDQINKYLKGKGII